ncbi:MAG: (Fe-S)-binding protein, partial [Dehalococcoidia bacterium]
TVRVLSRNGVEVTAPPSQRCCGALHAHSGDLETARDLARKTIDSFLGQEQQAAQRNISLTRPSSAHGQLNPASRSPKRMDAIVVNSAGCGSHMKEYAHLLRDDAAYADKAERLAGLVRDVNEYLAEIGIDPPTGARLHDGQTTAGALNRVVTYQDSCHLVHAQKVTDAPRALLRQIPGLELREMDHPERCCGSAGIYSVVQSKLSRDILQEKMQDINATGADQVCTANPGCMVQLDAGLRLHGTGALKNGRSLHVVELLDESYRIAEGRTYADRSR